MHDEIRFTATSTRRRVFDLKRDLLTGLLLLVPVGIGAAEPQRNVDGMPIGQASFWQERKNYEAMFKSLLALHPENAQGVGPEAVFPGIHAQPMTYGLLLMSECGWYRYLPSEEGRRRLREALHWVIRNPDLDEDGLVGWGLPNAWNAFGDNSVNPPNHPYTITSAIVAEGLLEAIDLHRDLREMSPFLDRDMAIAREELLDFWRRWSACLWTDQGSESFFWYSPSTEDANDVCNVNGFMIGMSVHLLSQPWIRSNHAIRTDIIEKTKKAARSILSRTELRKNLPFWPYMPVPNRYHENTPNDAVHHAYIVWGLERLRDSRLLPPCEFPYSKSAAMATVGTFIEGGRLFDYPRDEFYSADLKDPRNRPMRLWGAGALLAIVAEQNHEDRGLIDPILSNLSMHYGTFPALGVFPVDFSSDRRYIPRYGSHLLWALSRLAFPMSKERWAIAGAELDEGR